MANLPVPKKSENSFDRLPRFKADMVKKPVRVKVIGVREFPDAFAQFGDGVFVTIQLNGKQYEWAVRFTNENGNATKAYSGLYDALGKNANRWAGKSITLSPEKVKGLSPFVTVSK